jgi:asparagine synthase (glutamine-hydrolysing)
MCGICGFNFEDKSLIQEMSSLIDHRGPDESNYFVDDNISLGIRRLSIIDLEKGSQPQYNENEDIWLVFNGEIYNFLELREDLEKKGHSFRTDSDTEVIVHAYEEWNYNCLREFRGQFAFCIYDSRKKKLFLARDRLGVKPLYYYYNEGVFIFGSEIKPILAYGMKRKLNREALNLYLSLKYVPFNFTLFKGIYKLPPSSYLIYDLESNSFSKKKYWTLNFNINNDLGIEDFSKLLKRELEKSVKLRLISDVPLGAFLSGGLDSTAVVGIMSKYLDKPVRTFSVGFEEGSFTNELNYAKYVSEFYDTNHTEIIVESDSYELLPKIVWHLDDLIADAATIPVYLMSKYARNDMKVALTGDGADEIFAGYSVFYRRQKLNFAEYIPDTLIDYLMEYYQYIPNHLIRIALSYLNQSQDMESRYLRKIVHIPDEEKDLIFPYSVQRIIPLIKNHYMTNLNLIDQFIHWDLNYQLPNQFNMKIDKMSMASSLEARVPFLDHKIVELASSIPSKLKLYNNIEKYILRMAVKDIVPKKILRRKKTGFNVPLKLWLRKGFKELSGKLLERLSKREHILNSVYVKMIKRNRNIPYFENRVWNLLMFELWYETFFDNDGRNPITL